MSDHSPQDQAEESVWASACLEALAINAGADAAPVDVLTQAVERAIVEIEALEMLCFVGRDRRLSALGLNLEGVRRRLLAAQSVAEELYERRAAAEYRVREALPWACTDARRTRWLAR